MSNHPAVTESVALLNRLAAVLRDSALAEEKIDSEMQSRITAARKQYENAMAEHALESKTALDRLQTDFQAAQARLAAAGDNRKARLSRARASSKREAAQRIDHEEGRRKYEVQKGMMETTRRRAEELAQTQTAFEEWQRKLAETTLQLDQIDRQVSSAFRGYPAFRRLLVHPPSFSPANPAAELSDLFAQITAEQQQTETDLQQFRRLFLPRLFAVMPLWLWTGLIVIVTGGLVPLSELLGRPWVGWTPVISGGAALLAFIVLLFYTGRRSAGALAGQIAEHLSAARKLTEWCQSKNEAQFNLNNHRIESEAKSRTQTLEQLWEQALQKGAAARNEFPSVLEAKWERVTRKHEQLHRRNRERLEHDHAAALARLRQESQTRQQQLTQLHQSKIDRFKTEHVHQIQRLQSQWTREINRLQSAVQNAHQAAERAFPAWSAPAWQRWTAPRAFSQAVKFAVLEADLRQMARKTPQQLPQTGLESIELPLVLAYPHHGSLLIETETRPEAAIGTLNNLIYRLLAASPPGRLTFTIIDPLRLGQNFAGVMHLADYEENLIHHRIWTQPAQIEERLADLTEHMEKVIQMYLRNEFPTITEYNRQAGDMAEKFHFLVIADFPVNFTDMAVRRLMHIAASGARCGVYTFIHWDPRHRVPADLIPDELRKNSVCIGLSGNAFVLTRPAAGSARVQLEPPPPPELARRLLQQIGETSRGSGRVEVPFAQVAPAPEVVWSLDTTEELRVPIGRSGATKLQYLALGTGTRQHGLVAGKTGSGKSTLFHVIITNLALWCSPQQVEFYLVDFKKGVEFKGYALRRLPHARVVAIESDREFALSVLQRVDEELKRRGDLFRKLGVQDLPGFKRASGSESMPRSLLLIDEFQEFFVEEDRIAQTAAVLLDRIVRQGRAFGIHVLLGSQTLGGAYTLARTTIGQMVVRIALQCNEADSYLIMDENNPAPRLLSRPGEGIYNEMAGAKEGNNPFQTVWLPESERDHRLRSIRALADRKSIEYTGPIVFEGNAPADVRENRLLCRLLENPPTVTSPAPRIFLGAPNSIKGPTEIAFEPRTGNNLVVVGQRDESILAMVGLSLISLAAQHRRGDLKFFLLESAPAGSPEDQFLQPILSRLRHPCTVARPGEMPELIQTLAAELDARSELESTPSQNIFLLIHGLQNFKKFRQEEDFSFTIGDADQRASAAAQLVKIATDGPARRIHVIATIDTYNNITRFLGRKTLTEFERRVLFQMSANDSASLCDDPKASALGLHRALLYDEHLGSLETFRPYALPDQDWIESAQHHLDSPL